MSAQQDGNAFGRIQCGRCWLGCIFLPRLVELLALSLPDEAIVSICGVLSMLSARSTVQFLATVNYGESMGDLSSEELEY